MISKSSSQILKIHSRDNVVVALCDLSKGLTIQIGDSKCQLVNNVASKHKFSIDNLNIGDSIFMYGVVVGKAIREIKKGESITTFNISHKTESYEIPKLKEQIKWEAPNFSDFLNRKFLGYHRDNGAVGTENNWLVIPLVFCQNRNIEILKKTMLDKFGYEKSAKDTYHLDELIHKYNSGASEHEHLEVDLIKSSHNNKNKPLFSNVDGIYFLTQAAFLMVFAIFATVITLGVIFIGNMIGLYCLVGVSFFMSLMFPTIYGISQGGLTEDESKIGSAGLVMAIVGGALMPKLQGMLIDLGGYGVNDITISGVSEVNFSFILTALYFIYITLFGLKTSNIE